MQESINIDALHDGDNKTLTADWADSDNLVRIDSHSQTELHIKYIIHPSNTPAATIHMNWYPLYSIDAKVPENKLLTDYEWRPFSQTANAAANRKENVYQTHRIVSNQTDQEGNISTFARWAVPIGARLIKIRAKETGMGGNFGTYESFLARQDF